MPQRQHDTCTVNGCTRPHKSRGYCQTHYMQFRRGAPVCEEIKTRVRDKLPTCSIKGCENDVKANGLCAMHYQRKLRHGHTRYTDRKKPAKTCEIPDCGNIFYAKGMCHAHYIRARKAKSFGLTLGDYFDLLKAQNGACAICGGGEQATDGLSGKVRDLAIDHHHGSGAVRALLCSSCNRGLGLFRDDPQLLRKAADYLDQHQGDPPE